MNSLNDYELGFGSGLNPNGLDVRCEAGRARYAAGAAAPTAWASARISAHGQREIENSFFIIQIF
jgi:hypothetical protein